ncbi:MAG: adenylate/guanylate cyclase domain-containing protein [Chloroflexota bacterium]|jgi:guanylate cyclase
MQLAQFARRIFPSKVADRVFHQDDSEELRLKKSLLVASSLLIMLAGVIWGMLYLFFDEPIAGMIPLAYSLLSLISLAIFTWRGNYKVYRATQLILILLLPFFLMVALGGFVNSSAVILWSVLCPFGAVLFAKMAAPPRWMLFYVFLVILGGVLQPFTRASNNLPPTLIVPIFFVLNILAVTGIAFILLHYFVSERNKAYSLLREEQDRSERLLLNVLPIEIAQRLKDEPRIIADHLDSASVLFADIVGSTPLIAGMQPDEAVEWLNDLFSRFDRLVDKHRLEKIRTIGDGYMVASGAPVPRTDHAQAISLLGLEMCQEVATMPARNGHKINIRVGVNSGPMVAGVIGETKFHYDLWGDTVNTASRMESHGEPGRVQVTTQTYTLLKEEFDLEPRGAIQIRGKGEMETWFVVGKKEP